MSPMGRGTRAAGARKHGAAPAASEAAPAEPRGARPPRKSGRGATLSVLTMTLVALAGVGILAAQAEATAPHASANTTTKVAATATSTAAPAPDALPANSGSGTRVVYSPSRHRVWLVQGSTVSQTMVVVPGTVTPPEGTYTVYAKSPGSIGGDGVTVVYLVRFDSASSTVFGFDAEAGVAGLPPAPKGHTGGVRMQQTDAQVLYQFAQVGTNVVVVA